MNTGQVNMSEIVVLIPHYNNIAGLYRSLASLSAIEPVDVLIVDDSSLVKPDLLLMREQFKQIESIELICLEKNSGIETALNVGLERIFSSEFRVQSSESNAAIFRSNSGLRTQNSGLSQLNSELKYLARLDCGDICHSSRFMLQKAFLDKHLDYGMVGSWVEFSSESRVQSAELDETPLISNSELRTQDSGLSQANSKLRTQDSEFIVRYPETDSQIRNYMRKNSAFAHPAVMLRAAVLATVGNYSSNYKGAEDYDLFFRLLRVSKAANIPQVLTACELTATGISHSKRRQQIVSRIRLIWKNRDSSLGRATFGIIRSLLLLVIPYSLVLRLKSAHIRKLPNINPDSLTPNPQPLYPNPNPQIKIIHVIECASGGTLDVVVDLVNGMPEFQHLVVYGRRVDTPHDIRERFSSATDLIVWKNVRRKIGFHDLAAMIELIRIIINNRTAKIIHLHSSKAGFIGRVAAFLCGSSRKII